MQHKPEYCISTEKSTCAPILKSVRATGRSRPSGDGECTRFHGVTFLSGDPSAMRALTLKTEIALTKRN